MPPFGCSQCWTFWTSSSPIHPYFGLSLALPLQWNRDSMYQSMVTCIVDMHVTHSRYTQQHHHLPSPLLSGKAPRTVPVGSVWESLGDQPWLFVSTFGLLHEHTLSHFSPHSKYTDHNTMMLLLHSLDTRTWGCLQSSKCLYFKGDPGC